MPDEVFAPPEPAAPLAVSAGVPSEPPASSGAVSEPAPAWNGELEALAKEPWWASVPEPVRQTVTQGIQTKYTNFHRGADQARVEARAAQTAAETKAAGLERALAESKKSGEYWSKLLDADDAVKPLTAKVSTLEAALSERDAKLAQYEARVEAVERERVFQTHQTTYPDIYADFKEEVGWTEATGRAPQVTGAYVDFMQLVNAGVPEAKAARMVRATMEPAAEVAKPTRVPETPPRSVVAASNGAGPTAAKASRETNESYDDVMRRMRAAAEANGE